MIVNEIRENGTRRVALDFSKKEREAGKTQQHFKDECDVNLIVDRFKVGVPITHLAGNAAAFSFSSAQTFSEAAFIVAEAQSTFENQTAAVRAHFENSVIKFLDAAQDPKRRDEFVALGLLEPLKKEAEPTATETLAAQAKATQELADAATLAAQQYRTPSEEASE